MNRTFYKAVDGLDTLRTFFEGEIFFLLIQKTFDIHVNCNKLKEIIIKFTAKVKSL